MHHIIAELCPKTEEIIFEMVSFCETLFISLSQEMKIHIIKKQTIEEFIKKNSQSKSAFEIWFSIIKRTQWKDPKEIIATFNSADILGKGSERVVFNIGGNKYRMICSYKFGKNNVHLFVKWIGTHAAYTKLCNEQKQYKIDSF